jgi:hypothetical protein
MSKKYVHKCSECHKPTWDKHHFLCQKCWEKKKNKGLEKDYKRKGII